MLDRRAVAGTGSGVEIVGVVGEVAGVGASRRDGRGAPLRFLGPIGGSRRWWRAERGRGHHEREGHRGETTIGADPGGCARTLVWRPPRDLTGLRLRICRRHDASRSAAGYAAPVGDFFKRALDVVLRGGPEGPMPVLAVARTDRRGTSVGVVFYARTRLGRMASLRALELER